MALQTVAAPLCFLDTETDGVHPGRKVWEVAVVRREPTGVEIEWQSFVRIDRSGSDPFGLRVGRFYDRHPDGRTLATPNPDDDPDVYPAADPRQVATRVARLTHGAHIVGAVPNFDTEVLDRLLREHGHIPAWHYHLIDIENLAVGYLAAKGTPVRPPYRSDDLSEALGVPTANEDERHTAMGDVRWVMRMYDAIMNGGA